MRQFDLLRSVPTDLLENTARGGLLTIILLVFAEILLISEVMYYMTTTYEETVGVGNSFNDKIDLYLDLTLDSIGCDQLQIKLWDKYQDKPVPITGSSFHMTRVTNGVRDSTSTSETDLHKHDSDYLAHSQFEHAELEKDWNAPDPNFNEHTFHEQIDAHDLVYIFFYADWCPHCRALHPKWKQTVSIIDDSDVKDGDKHVLKIAVIQINCVPFETLCWEKNVSDYPTIRLYSRNESYVTYKGEKKVNSMVEFVTEKALQTHHKDIWVPDRTQEGCHLKGLLRLPRVPGHLQFNKRGKGHSVGWADLSHTVHHYTFLDPEDSISVGSTGLDTNPLDGQEFKSEDKNTAIAHYATLVQTKLEQGWPANYRYVYQMSVLSVENKLQDKRQLSIRFVHDLFPMAVTYSKEPKSIFQFFIRIGAVIGGLYTILYLVHLGVKKKSH